MKYGIVLFLAIFLLSSCGSDVSVESSEGTPNGEANTDVGTKGNSEREGPGTIGGDKVNSNEFVIETKTLSDYNNNSTIEKVGKISSNEVLDVKAQVSGKLTSIYVKEGEDVYIGQVIAKLEDSYSKYYLDLEKAEIDYEKSIISKESQILSLDKQISDAQINLDDTFKNYENASKTATEELKEAKLNYENSDLIDTNSQSYLELEKAKLDYENTIYSNTQQINTYVSNVQKEYNNLILSLTDIIKFSDELLGVTDEYKYSSKGFDDYLGAKNKEFKNNAKDSLRELIAYKKVVEEISIADLNEENLVTTMDSFYDGYEKINTLLGLVESTLNNSIVSISNLSSSDIDGYISKGNSYQSSNQGNLSGFNSTRSSIISFLNTYKNSELSSLKNVELKEKELEDSSVSGETSYNKIVVSIENDLNSYESKYKQAQLSYDNAVANKEITIKSLNNSIASAKNNRDKYSLEYSKLTITSPISGIISSVDIDNNSDISSGTQIFTIISNNKTQIDVSLTSSEIGNINIGDDVKVNYLDKEYSGSVYSKSSVADDNLEYNVTVLLNENLDLIGGSTIVEFLSTNENILLPLDVVDITGDNIGIVNYYEDLNLHTMDVNLGKIEGNNIEILTPIPSNLEVIITDLSNYNSLNQTLKVNNN